MHTVGVTVVWLCAGSDADGSVPPAPGSRHGAWPRSQQPADPHAATIFK